MPKYQNIAAAWINETKQGNKYLSVKIEKDLKAGDKIALFKNDKGGVETRPDYRAYEKINENLGEQAEEVFTSEDVANDIPF